MSPSSPPILISYEGEADVSSFTGILPSVRENFGAIVAATGTSQLERTLLEYGNQVGHLTVGIAGNAQNWKLLTEAFASVCFRIADMAYDAGEDVINILVRDVVKRGNGSPLSAFRQRLAEIFEKWEGPGDEFSGSRETAGMEMLDEVSRAVPVFLASVPRNASIERNSFPAQTRIPVAVRSYGSNRVYSSCKTREINAWILNVKVETAGNGREGVDPAAEEFSRCRSKGRYSFAEIHEWMNSVSGGPDGPRAETDVEEDISPPATPNDRSAKNATVEDEDEDNSSSDPKSPSGSCGSLFTTTTSSSSPSPFPLTGSSAATSGDIPHFGGRPGSSKKDIASSKGCNKRRSEGIFTIPSAKRSRGKYDWEMVGQLHHYGDGVVESTPKVESNPVAFKTRNKRSVDEGTFRLPLPKRARVPKRAIIEAFAPDYKFPAIAIQTVDGSEAESTGFENIDLVIDEDYFKPIFATKPSHTRESNVFKRPISEEATSNAGRPDKPIITGIKKILSWFSTKSSKTLDYNILQPSTIPVPKIEDKLLIARKMPSSSSALERNIMSRPTTPPPKGNKFVRKFTSQSDGSCILPMFATKSSPVHDYTVLSPIIPLNEIRESVVTQEVDSESDEDLFLSMFATKPRRVRNYGTSSKPRQGESAPIRTILSRPAVSEEEDISYGFSTKSSPVLDQNVSTSLPSGTPPKKNSTLPALTANISCLSDYNVVSTPRTPSAQRESKSISTTVVSNSREVTILPELITKSSRTPNFDLLSTPVPIISGEIMNPRRLNKTKRIPKIVVTPPNDDSFQLPNISRVLDDHALAASISWRPTWNSQTRFEVVPVIIITPPEKENFQPPKFSRVLDYNALAIYSLKRRSAQKEDRPIPTIVITAPDEENITPLFTMASPTLAEVGSSCKSGNKTAVSKKMTPPPKKENTVPMFTTKSSRVLDHNVLASTPLSKAGSGSKIENKPILPKKIVSPPKKIVSPPKRKNTVPMFTTKSSRVLDNNVLKSITGNKPILPKKIISSLAGKTLIPAPATRKSRILDHNVLTPLSISAENSASPRQYTLTKMGSSIPKVRKTLPIFVGKSSRIADGNVLSPQGKKTKVGSVLPSKPATVNKKTVSSIPKKTTPCASKVKGKAVLKGKSTNVRTKPSAASDKPPLSTPTSSPNKRTSIPTIAIAKGNSLREYTTTVRKTTTPTVHTERKNASAFQKKSAPVVIPVNSILPATETLPTTRKDSLPTTVEVATKQKITPAIEKLNSKAIRSTAGGIKIRPMNLTLSLCPKEGRCLRASASSFVPYSAEKTVELIPKVLSARRNGFRI